MCIFSMDSHAHHAVSYHLIVNSNRAQGTATQASRNDQHELHNQEPFFKGGIGNVNNKWLPLDPKCPWKMKVLGPQYMGHDP